MTCAFPIMSMPAVDYKYRGPLSAAGFSPYGNVLKGSDMVGLFLFFAFTFVIPGDSQQANTCTCAGNFTASNYTQEITVSECFFFFFTANSTGLIRLVNGGHPAQGNVEIRYNLTSPWGTICSSGWDIRDARVVCRQLGYADAVAATIESSFGTGQGSIWLNNIRCNGFENKISECGSSDWGNPGRYSNCVQYATTSTSYHGVAGAVCRGNYMHGCN